VTDTDIGGHFWSDQHLGEHARHPPMKTVISTAQAVPATAGITTYASFPTPVRETLTFIGGPWLCAVFLAAYVDIGVNNVEIALALDTAAVPAGSKPENRLHLNAKSPAGTTLTMSEYETVNAGDITFELMHAGGAATVSDIKLAVIPLGLLPP
jgi:hypothetical protein